LPAEASCVTGHFLRHDNAKIANIVY